jgi:diguanylate cyclase (GGDEF)-like protein
MQMLLDATDHLALVLDTDRRIVAASRTLLDVLGLATVEPLLGWSPGEVISCLWAHASGCGSAAPCKTCGVFLSLTECQVNRSPSAHESLLSMNNEGSGTLSEFRMRTTPLRLDATELTFLSLMDLSDSKRREALEQFFFQQVLNLTDGLDGTVRILAAEPESAPLLIRQLADFTQQLTQEVQGRRILLQAENGTLRVETQETGLDEIMDSLGAFFRNHDVAHRRTLRLMPFHAERFQTDPTLLLQILVDLVMNALEATPVDGTVTVECERKAGERCFHVRNPSVIPADVACRVFQRAFSTKAVGGRGLGTFGLRLLAERYLGGQVGFTTDETEGTCFTLRLPAPETLHLSEIDHTNSPPSLAVEDQTPAKEKAGTVLIVDDTKVIRHLVQAILSKDFNVLLAESGPEAMAMSAERMPDLVVLDVVMPDMDGYEVCRNLKSNPATATIPIIFLTSLTGTDYETQALESGAIDFITKPINPDVVYARVKNHVEMKQAQDHLKDLSLQDAMTGIANRRAFDKAIEYEWRRGIRSRKPLSVIMGDVDFFKRYNDSFGHQQGDACLKAVAQAFASSINRPSDTAARYGGEEFVCVLGDTDENGALLVAEKIRTGVEQLKMPHPNSEAGAFVTVSLGISTIIPNHQTGFLALVEEADHWLYEAKRRGRNQIARA